MNQITIDAAPKVRSRKVYDITGPDAADQFVATVTQIIDTGATVETDLLHVRRFMSRDRAVRWLDKQRGA